MTINNCTMRISFHNCDFPDYQVNSKSSQLTLVDFQIYKEIEVKKHLTIILRCDTIDTGIANRIT